MSVEVERWFYHPCCHRDATSVGDAACIEAKQNDRDVVVRGMSGDAKAHSSGLQRVSRRKEREQLSLSWAESQDAPPCVFPPDAVPPGG